MVSSTREGNLCLQCCCFWQINTASFIWSLEIAISHTISFSYIYFNYIYIIIIYIIFNYIFSYIYFKFYLGKHAIEKRGEVS